MSCVSCDPIADMLTRIRNGQKAGHASVVLPASNIKQRLAQLLCEEGYVGDVSMDGQGAERKLTIKLKYDQERRGVIDGLQRVSRPGLRIYRGYSELESVRGGLGVAILSTSRGLLTDREARARKIGGEVLCRVW